MIGNNSCGATAQRTGKVVDNVVSLDVLLHDGTRFTARSARRRGLRRDRCRPAATGRPALLPGAAPAPRRPRRPDPRPLPRHPAPGVGLQPRLAAARARFRRRRAPGGERVDPGHGAAGGARAGAGGQGPHPGGARLPRHRCTAADAVPAIVEHEPIALEGVDHYLVRDEQLKGMNPDALDELPDGHRLPDGPVRRRGHRRGRRAGAPHAGRRSASPSTTRTSPFFDDPDREDELWAVREAGLGATAHVPGTARTPSRAGRTPRSRSSGSATTCATCAASTTSSATPATPAPASTGTSARAACTPGSRSTSTPPRASRPTAGSWSGPPTWSCRTAVRCPASTATARAAASCCPGCSATRWSGCSSRSRRSSTPTTG